MSYYGISVVDWVSVGGLARTSVTMTPLDDIATLRGGLFKVYLWTISVVRFCMTRGRGDSNTNADILKDIVNMKRKETFIVAP